MGEQVIPRDLKFAGYENSIGRQKSILAKGKRLSDTLKQLRENYIKEVDDILGSRHKEYLKLRQKLREQALDMQLLFSPTPEGEKIKNQFKKMRSAKVRDFITHLGDDFTEVKNVQKVYGAQVSSAVQEAMEETRGPLADTNAPPFDDNPINPWVYRYPPYIEASGSQIKFEDDLVQTLSHFENASTGEIGCKSSMNVAYTDEGARGQTRASSEVWFSYQLPTSVSGLVEVVAYLQCIETPFHGSLEDEFGFSDAESEATSSIYLVEVVPEGQLPEPRYATVLDIRKSSDGDDISWSGEVLSPGKYLYPHLYSMHPYAAGQLITLKLGVHDWHWGEVNDMGIYSSITNRWVVSKIAVRCSPTP
jgi:hypothetical protein